MPIMGEFYVSVFSGQDVHYCQHTGTTVYNILYPYHITVHPCSTCSNGVDSHKYLGVMVTKDGTSVAETHNRIGQGNQLTRQLHFTL